MVTPSGTSRREQLKLESCDYDLIGMNYMAAMITQVSS